MRYRLTLFLMTLLLAACGGGSEEASPIQPTPTLAPTLTAEIPPTATAEVVNHGEYPCFNLPEDDCALMLQAAENTANMTSFSQVSTLSVSITGMAPLTLLVDIPAELTLDATSSGDFTVDTDDIPAAVALDLQADLTADGAPAYAVDLWMTFKDSNIYFPLTDETLAVPLDTATIDQTLDVLNLPPELASFLPLEDIISNDPANFGTFIFADQLGVILNPSGADIAPYSTLTRAADTEWMGQTMQVFVYTLDMREMLNSDDFGAMIALTSGQAPDDPTLAFALQLLPVILEQVQSEMVVTQYIGAEDALVHRLTFDLDFTLNIGQLLTPSSPTANEPLVADLTFDVTLSDINGEKAISTPDNVRFVTVSELPTILTTIPPAESPAETS